MAATCSRWKLTLLLALLQPNVVLADSDTQSNLLGGGTGSFPARFLKKPPVSPAYMVDNTRNTHGVAPVNGQSNGPVWPESNSFDAYMKNLEDKPTGNNTKQNNNSTYRYKYDGNLFASDETDYWLPKLAKHGMAPLAGDNYQFYRNVLDYKADNSGETNTEEAINAAIIDGDRCGEECGNTFVQGAVIYFPPGTYKICTPIIQYYYTQFVGDALDPPIIKGCDNFSGIALIDTDPYVPNAANPDGTGVNWYINQNQFFRQIRNFVFDMTEMPAATDEHDQQLVPTGIHWQVSQACTLHNLEFNMPEASDKGNESTTHVGIFTENGSGGFVSDLRFNGGAIGWRAGSQQYTAIGLKFKNCITAVQMVWDWGFNWQRIEVDGGSIGFNISGRGGIDGQGIGSVSIIDSDIKNVPIGILTNTHKTESPNIVIDNVQFHNVGTFVKAEDSKVLLEGGSSKIDLWTHGRRYNGGKMVKESGFVKDRPKIGKALLEDGKLFVKKRPQYEQLGADSFLIATDNGCKNDGTGDNTDAINDFLKKALQEDKVAYFPGGIYSIKSTVTVPAGSRVHGSSWSQIQATGSYFEDPTNPNVAVRVGEIGDVGRLEIVDMLFTVKGPTAGAIMVEWNILASRPGDAGMWDSHIRVGGGIGTDLDIEKCPKGGFNEGCMCVSLLLHVTHDASGYFENVWAWVADHDNDMSLYWETDKMASQISLYGARGILVESQGPCWFYGSGSEHVIYYQYQMYGAKDIYLGHIQTESPYFQPNPVSPRPFNKVRYFPGDPDWYDCSSEECQEAWGVRIIDSDGVIIHSAGLYSWFRDYEQDCLASESCQKRIMDVSGSKNVAIYNIFAKAVEEIASTEDYNILQDDNQQGYTSQICAWFPGDGFSDAEIAYLGPELYDKPQGSCNDPCIIVLAPSPLSERTTIEPGPYITSVEVGSTTTTLTLTPKPVTTDAIEYSNVRVTHGQTAGAVYEITTRVPLENTTVVLDFVDKDGTKTSTEREIIFPPWPQINTGPPGGTFTHNATTSTGPVITPEPPTTTYPGPITTVTTNPPTRDTEFPVIELEPIYEDFEDHCTEDECPAEEKNDDDDDDIIIGLWFRFRCNTLWFFNFCPNTDKLKIKGWRIWLPRKISGPEPPTIKPKLPDWNIIHPPPLPPWPEITVYPDKMKFPKKDPSCDDNKVSVPVEMYSITYGFTVSDGVTVTTATRTATETVYDTGCPMPDWTSTSVCNLNPKRTAGTETAPATADQTQMPVATELGLSSRQAPLPEWQNDGNYCGDERDVIIYLSDSSYVAMVEVVQRLDYDITVVNGMRWLNVNHDKLGTIFLYAWNMPRGLYSEFSGMPGVANIRRLRPLGKKQKRAEPVSNAWRGNVSGVDDYTGQPLRKRDAFTFTRWSKQSWWRTHISKPPNFKIPYDGVRRGLENFHEFEQSDDKGIDRQYIYLFENGIDDPGNTDITSIRVEKLPEFSADMFEERFRDDHSELVARLMVGSSFGFTPQARFACFPDSKLNFGSMREVYLIAALRIIENIEDVKNPKKGRCVINMSFELQPGTGTHHDIFKFWFGKLLQYMEHKLGCVLVVAAGNDPKSVLGRTMPDFYQFHGGLELNMLIVGATGRQGHRATFTTLQPGGKDDAMVYAPGHEMNLISRYDTSGLQSYIQSGTSFSAPLVASLVAFYRGLTDSKWHQEFQKPASVVKMIKHLSRPVVFSGQLPKLDKEEDPNVKPAIIWDGHVGRENCLVPYSSDMAKKICDEYLANVPVNLDNWTPQRRGPGNGGSFTWSQGLASPTCTGHCGTLCKGYYCQSNPRSAPPDFIDPVNKPKPSATSRPTVTFEPPVTMTTSTEPPTRPTGDATYDCKGGSQCQWVIVPKDCNRAANKLKGDNKEYSSDGSSVTDRGACAGEPFITNSHGCAVIIRGEHDGGKPCKMKGKDIYDAYYELRDKGECGGRPCGSIHFGNGCMVTADYYKNCPLEPFGE